MPKDQPYCVKFGCNKTPLIYLKKGQTRQTNNGFLIVYVSGLYCPNCAAGYGGDDSWETKLKTACKKMGKASREGRMPKVV